MNLLEEEFINELNKLVSKYGVAIDSEGDLFTVFVDGTRESKVIFSKLVDKYILFNN